MPFATGRPRAWSIVVAMAAVALALTVCCSPASARPQASDAPAVVVGCASEYVDAFRATELRPTTSPHQAPQYLALATPSPRAAHAPLSRPAPRPSYRLTPSTPVGDAAPRGRAPPAA